MPNTPTLVGDLGVRHDKTVEALRSLGRQLKVKPRAVVVLSPHFVTGGGVAVVAQRELRQIYDFYGFPDKFYSVRYRPHGDPELAEVIARKINSFGVPCTTTEEWGLDHGAWSPLMHVFPNADVPVIPLSLCDEIEEISYRDVGRAVRAVAEETDLFVCATGSIIHRLDLYGRDNSSVPEVANRYLGLVTMALINGEWDKIWSAPVSWMREASPEGGLVPLRFLSGVVGNRFMGHLLANEIEFNAASLTTVKLDEVREI